MLSQQYDLSCWYINFRRLMEVFGPLPDFDDTANISRADNLLQIKRMVLAKNLTIDRLHKQPPPTFGKLAATGRVSPGAVFTYHGKFFCKGLSAFEQSQTRGKLTSSLPYIYTNFPDSDSKRRLSVTYHPEHLTSTSAYEHLRGTQSLFVFGFIDTVDASGASAKPYVIGSIVLNIFERVSPIKWGFFEVSVEQIDSFSKIRSQKTPKVAELELLKSVPEEAVKNAIAEIIEEPIVKQGLGRRAF